MPRSTRFRKGIVFHSNIDSVVDDEFRCNIARDLTVAGWSAVFMGVEHNPRWTDIGPAVGVRYNIVTDDTVTCTIKRDTMPVIHPDNVFLYNPIVEHTVKAADTLQGAVKRLVGIFVVNDGIATQYDTLDGTSSHLAITATRP